MSLAANFSTFHIVPSICYQYYMYKMPRLINSNELIQILSLIVKSLFLSLRERKRQLFYFINNFIGKIFARLYKYKHYLAILIRHVIFLHCSFSFLNVLKVNAFLTLKYFLIIELHVFCDLLQQELHVFYDLLQQDKACNTNLINKLNTIHLSLDN